MTVWTFDIPKDIPSANVLRRGRTGKANWFRYKRHRTEFAWFIAAAAKRVPRADGARTVKIERLMGKTGKPYDHDNLVGGAKGLLDELAAAGLLVGDAPHEVQVEYTQERGTEREAVTRVTLRDMEES